MKRVLRNLAVLAVVAVGGHGMFASNIVMNGTFSPVPSGSFTTVFAPSTSIPGWTVTSGSVDWVGNYWQAPPSGGASIDMDGDTPGTMSQTLTTTPGRSYMVDFYLSGNPDGGPVTKTLDVSLGGVTDTFHYTLTGNRSDMDWILESFIFNAIGASTQLVFQSGDALGNPYGPVIGGVSVAATPEPSSLLLLCTGLAGLAFFLRRKMAA